jgi:anthranilate/para-aminobenzoate synthase component I
MAGELKEHPKEIAEHVMLVDLARNDVGGGAVRHDARSTS